MRISRNKLCTKENSNKKIKDNFRWRKREPTVVDSTFYGKEFPDPLLTEISPYMYFKLFFDDDLIKHIADQTNLYSVQCTGKTINVDEYLVFYYSFLSSSLNKKNTCFEEVERPMIVQVFFDLCTMPLSLYRIRQRTKTFYFHVVYYLLRISVTNGCLLYHRHQNQKRIPEKNQLSMLEFQTAIERIYDLLGNWRQHQDYQGEGHHSPALLKSLSKNAGCQEFQILLIIHVLMNLIIFLYSKRSSNAAENAKQAILLKNFKNVEHLYACKTLEAVLRFMLRKDN